MRLRPEKRPVDEEISRIADKDNNTLRVRDTETSVWREENAPGTAIIW